MFHSSLSFVRYNHALAEADVGFLGVPFAAGSLSRPALYGPVIVRESLKMTDDSTTKGRLFSRLRVCDMGDIEVSPSYEETAKRIKETIDDMKSTNSNVFMIFVGGDHTITLPIVESLKPKTIVQLDAHADLLPEYLGAKYMQQTWGYHAAEQRVKIVQIGVRSWNEGELAYSKKKGISSFTPEAFLKTLPDLPKPVHLTLDMDVFDPCYAETGLPVPDGLAPKEVFAVLGALDIRSMDVVEIADDRLPSKTGFLAAECIKKVLEKKLE